MRDLTSILFDEFAAAYRAGSEPDLRDYLARAGDDAPTFARLVDGFLAGSEPPAPTTERVELMRAWVRGEPPLLELRKRRRMKRSDVTARLTELLGLAPERAEKVHGYLHELETGQLEPRGVDARVWDALAQVLGADVRALARWRPAPFDTKLAYMRASAPPAGPPLARARRESLDDEVDRLFLSGS